MPDTDQKPAELSKTYSPEQHEPGVWQRWLEADAFHADPAEVLSGDKPPYCVLIPPPNVTAALHLGHALNNTIQDVLVRAHRMKGFETLWLPGTDHAGIATQTVVDKRLKEAGKPALAEHKAMERAGEPGREKFIALVQSWKDEYEARITDQLKAMGCSCDWDRQRFTMDELCARAVREAFFRLFKDGLIERGKRLVNWDPATQTALSDDEVENKEIEGNFYYLRYPLCHRTEPGNHNPVTWGELEAKGYPGADTHPEDDEAWITVATTRPETYLGDVAVAMNPKDPRAEALKGLLAEIPLTGRTVPILQDDYVVLPIALGGDENDAKAKMATGFLKVTPAHDPNDWMLGQRHQQAIEQHCSAGTHLINVMAPDGSISADHGWPDFEPHGAARVFIGLSREDARQKVVKEFQAHTINNQPLLEDIKPHTHTVGHSYRSHVPVEPYLSDQWYCRVTDDRLRGHAQRALVPEQRTDASLSDWPESAPNEPRPSGSGPRTTYLITFTTYGTWLHGDERGSADRDHNLPGTPYLDPDAARESAEERELKHPTVSLDQTERELTANAIAEVCDHRDWQLHACNVRSNHAHVVVTADAAPERVMNDFKSYATRAMKGDPRSERAATARERTWTRHGSTRYLNDETSATAAVRYVLGEQGDDLGGVIDGRLRTPRKPLPHGRGSSDGSMTFYPSRYAKTYENWHDNLRDWCISRQLWWGHRIPVWTSIYADGGDSDWAKWQAGSPPTRRLLESIEAHYDAFKALGVSRDDVFVSYIDHVADSVLVTVSPRTRAAEEAIERIESDGELRDQYRENTFTQDPDVLDTWFSSALWPLSTLGWPNHDLPLLTPEKIDPLAHPNIKSVWVKRVGTFRDFIGTEGEPSGDLIEKLLHLRDTASTADGTQPLAYQLFSEADLARDGHDAQPLTKTKDIGEATDLVCAVGVKSHAPLEATKFGVIDIPALLRAHGFQDTPGLLAAFNPTSVLTTAREIITLWVSRMAMFNRYFLGNHTSERAATVRERSGSPEPSEETASSRSRLVDAVTPGPIPFHDVFIHAMIQDGEGRKMSKSLGNGVDPLDIIHSHGADAMRFTLVEMTTQTQDVRMPVEHDESTGKNTSPKFDLGRNFCNKLWNAARFALSKIPSDLPETIDPSDLTLADRWMLTRLREGLAEIDNALATYQFSAYAKALYDLVRRDFCDWYLEAIKGTVASNPAQQGALRLILDSLLRLLHPVIPFITETIHERLSTIPAPSLAGLTLTPPEKGDVLATAGWPAVDESLADADAKATFERVRTIVDEIRAVRSANQVEPRRKVALHASAELAREITAAAGLVESLAGLHTMTTDAPEGASAAFTLDGVEHRLSDLADALDAGAEKERLEKEKADLEKSIKALEGRLGNPGYTEKAPPHLVQQTRDEHAKAQADLDAIKASLESLA